MAANNTSVGVCTLDLLKGLRHKSQNRKHRIAKRLEPAQPALRRSSVHHNAKKLKIGPCGRVSLAPTFYNSFDLFGFLNVHDASKYERGQGAFIWRFFPDASLNVCLWTFYVSAYEPPLDTEV